MAKKKAKKTEDQKVDAGPTGPAVNYVPSVEERVAKLEQRVDAIVAANTKSRPLKGI